MEMRPSRILVVDDEPPIVDLVTGYLVREGWQVSTAADGPSALDAVRAYDPDVVVLDVMLPGLDGVEVCRRLRTFSDAYVLMLTARGEEIDRIMGLTVGADDYLVKPFSPRELVARIKAVLRRPRTGAGGGPERSAGVKPAAGSGDPAAGPAPAPGPTPAAGPASSTHAPGMRLPEGLDLDEGRRTVRVDGRPVELTALEFNLLALLAREPGIVVRRTALLQTLWGDAYDGDDHLVDVHVANLRRKLGDEPASPRFVETVRGVGYRLREPA